MIDILTAKATDVRKDWSTICDSVIHDKPRFIKRTRDRMWFSSLDTLTEILKAYSFTAKKYIESDGSVTLSLNEIDLIENGIDEVTARLALGNAILNYSFEYYKEYSFYSHSPNRKAHVPYIFKALIMDNPEQIGEIIICQDGEN
ncbi:MAG: hypothetical protein U0L59_02380 [Faecalimonas sp.]|nr:hypothetical protein [Faecalimonas sp.]